MKEFLLAWIKPMAILLSQAAASVAAFFSGIFFEKRRNAESENKILRDNIALLDSDLADKLRDRAKRKDKNKRRG